MNLKYVLEQGGPVLIISEAAIDVMMQYRQMNHNSREAGGQLFAQFQGAETTIVEATRPKLLDRRLRHRFEPNRRIQQREIRDRHSKGLHFVGDWHTHPQDVPHPSSEDMKNMNECFALSTHELNAFIMIIVGKKPVPDGLYVALVKAAGITPLMPKQIDLVKEETV